MDHRTGGPELVQRIFDPEKNSRNPAIARHEISGVKKILEQ
jgi:hypothetical protein